MAGRCAPHRAPEQHSIKSSENHHFDKEIFAHCSASRRLVSARALGPAHSPRLRREARRLAITNGEDNSPDEDDNEDDNAATDFLRKCLESVLFCQAVS